MVFKIVAHWEQIKVAELRKGSQISVKKFKPKRALVWIAITVLTRHFACPVRYLYNMMVVKFRSICIIFCFVYYNHSIIFGYKYMQLGSYYIEPWPIVFYQNFCWWEISQTFNLVDQRFHKIKRVTKTAEFKKW